MNPDSDSELDLYCTCMNSKFQKLRSELQIKKAGVAKLKERRVAVILDSNKDKAEAFCLAFKTEVKLESETFVNYSCRLVAMMIQWLDWLGILSNFSELIRTILCECIKEGLADNVLQSKVL